MKNKKIKSRAKNVFQILAVTMEYIIENLMIFFLNSSSIEHWTGPQNHYD